jgi:hypothetical protein
LVDRVQMMVDHGATDSTISADALDCPGALRPCAPCSKVVGQREQEDARADEEKRSSVLSLLSGA